MMYVVAQRGRDTDGAMKVWDIYSRASSLRQSNMQSRKGATRGRVVAFRGHANAAIRVYRKILALIHKSE